MEAARIPFVVISGRTVRALIGTRAQECVDVIREAYIAHDAGRTVNPPSVFLRPPSALDSRIIALPAHFSEPTPVSGIKWIASYPRNTGQGLKRASAVLILNDGATGYPFACLEASLISAARTAASAALAADYIRGAGNDLGELGVVGTGEIARNVVQFLMRGSKSGIRRVYAYDTNPEALARFRDWFVSRHSDTEITLQPSADIVLSSARMTLFATIAAAPHITDLQCFASNPVILHLSLRDLDPAIILASNNVVDDPQHVLSAATSVDLAAKSIGHSNFITCTLADLLLGRGSLISGKPTIFSPFGLGILDLALGHWIYKQAIAAGDFTEVRHFFDE